MRSTIPARSLKHGFDIIARPCPGPWASAPAKANAARHGGESEQCETLHDRSIPFGRVQVPHRRCCPLTDSRHLSPRGWCCGICHVCYGCPTLGQNTELWRFFWHGAGNDRAQAWRGTAGWGGAFAPSYDFKAQPVCFSRRSTSGAGRPASRWSAHRRITSSNVLRLREGGEVTRLQRA